MGTANVRGLRRHAVRREERRKPRPRSRSRFPDRRLRRVRRRRRGSDDPLVVRPGLVSVGVTALRRPRGRGVGAFGHESRTVMTGDDRRSRRVAFATGGPGRADGSRVRPARRSALGVPTANLDVAPIKKRATRFARHLDLLRVGGVTGGGANDGVVRGDGENVVIENVIAPMVMNASAGTTR